VSGLKVSDGSRKRLEFGEPVLRVRRVAEHIDVTNAAGRLEGWPIGPSSLRSLTPITVNHPRAAAPVGAPWLWTLAFGYHEDRTPTYGYEPNTRGGDGGIRQELATE
jgi:hypothetical protein